MSLWRIRIAMSDDPRSQELLTEALAGQRVRSRLMSPRDTQMTVDVIVEPADVDGLGALLGELHMISPQVFVSSVTEPHPLRPGSQQAGDEGLTEPALITGRRPALMGYKGPV